MFNPIRNGYGEFIVYDDSSNKIPESTYEKAYIIFCKYFPGELARNFQNDELLDQYENRHTFIQKEVEQLNPHLKTGFIPRTLYELRFLRLAIEEDLERGVQCRWQKIVRQKPGHYAFKISQSNQFISMYQDRIDRLPQEWSHIEDLNKRNQYIQEDRAGYEKK